MENLSKMRKLENLLLSQVLKHLRRSSKIAKRYYKETFNVDLDKVRDTVIERENNVVNGSYNLTILIIKKGSLYESK